LGQDVSMLAELEVNRRQVEGLQSQLDEATDGRSKGRIRRALDKAEMEVTRLEIMLDLGPDQETALWVDLWSSPQAVIWEESHAEREVAQYVRWKIRGEQGDLRASAEARQLSDRLGLNPLALMRLRAEVEHADEAEDRGAKRRQTPTGKKTTAKRRSTRSGLHAV
jgi:hypothetical protein